MFGRIRNLSVAVGIACLASAATSADAGVGYFYSAPSYYVAPPLYWYGYSPYGYGYGGFPAYGYAGYGPSYAYSYGGYGYPAYGFSAAP